MAAHNIGPAYTPTYSSWLNGIEARYEPQEIRDRGH